MAQTNRNGGESSKAPRDYARLLLNAEILRDGWELRWSKQRSQMTSLLKDIPNREVIMQTIERAMDTRAAFREAEADVAKYERLIAASATPATPAVEAPAAS